MPLSVVAPSHQEEDGGDHDADGSIDVNAINAISGPHSTGHHQQGQAVVSLLAKYSALHRGIDQARQAQEEQKHAIDSTEREIERIHVVRTDMKEQADQAIRERHDLLDELERTLERLAQVQEEHSNVVSAKDRARQRMEAAMQVARDQRDSFLQSCHEFRGQVHRLSEQAVCLGLSPLMAPLTAYSVVHPTTSINADIALLLAATPTMSLKSSQDADMGSDNSSSRIDGSDPNNDEKDREGGGEDDELRHVMNRLVELEKSREGAQQDLELCRDKRSSALQAQQKRDLQEQNLQSQLQKLEQDLQGIHSQIETVQQEMDETKQMTLVFQADVEQRRQRKAAIATKLASAAASRNPYVSANQMQQAASTSTTGDGDPGPPSRAITPNMTRNNNSSGSATRDSAHQNSAVRGLRGQERRSPNQPQRGRKATANQQFPHRSGRVRSSRQFGASLRISSLSADEMVPSSGREAAASGTQWKGLGDSRGHMRIGDSSDEDEDLTLNTFVNKGPSTLEASRPGRSAGGNEDVLGPKSSKLPRLLDLNDDDDDDDVLSHSPVAFPKKK